MQQAAVLAGGAAAGAASVPVPTEARPAVPQASGPAVRVATPDAAVVPTNRGPVRGSTRNGVYIFRGMPYGQSTAGQGRFRPAQPPAHWAGVRSSTSWGPVCPHAPRGGWVNDEEQFLYQWDDGVPGEDMLRLNVWTPGVNDDRRRPVLVWIHGGGFQSGSSQELRPYDGENLARHHDAVLVSMNHRLNVFGFLDLSSVGGSYASSGNVGMLDLMLALEWVRDNISDFGGNPNNVTIFGQSGGGRKVSTLMGMPSAQGLFHKAAVLSGSHLRQNLPGDSARLAGAVLDDLGLTSSTLGEIHDVPTDVLLNAGIAVRAADGSLPGWGPVVDGVHLPAHAFDPGAPAIASAVPLLVGNTFVEFGGGINAPDANALTFEELRADLEATEGDRSDDLIAAYRAVFPDAPPFEIRGLIVGTRAYRINAVRQAELKAVQNTGVYTYWFGWNTPVLDGRPLAYHCQDLAFWFDNIDRAAQATGGTDDARALATTMSRQLVAFARTGSPNGEGLPEWPAFDPAGRSTMVYRNNRVSVQADPDREARELLESLGG